MDLILGDERYLCTFTDNNGLEFTTPNLFKNMFILQFVEKIIDF